MHRLRNCSGLDHPEDEGVEEVEVRWGEELTLLPTLMFAAPMLLRGLAQLLLLSPPLLFFLCFFPVLSTPLIICPPCIPCSNDEDRFFLVLNVEEEEVDILAA